MIALRNIFRLCCAMMAIAIFPVTLGWNMVPSPFAEPRNHSSNPFDTIRTDLTAYRWPMKTSRAITSSLGEFRSTHFHAGIDISTGDTIGLPVIASRDGYISRIAVSPTGYGKILHLRHADRYTTAYAHLSGFPPWIDSLVHAEQLRNECYPVVLTLPPNALRVTAGQVIAYAGDTGSGSAHLHFEIRDEFNNTINPLLAEGFTIDDALPPHFKSLAFVPIAGGGTVNGSRRIMFARPRQTSKGKYVIDDIPVLVGTAGLAVDVRDISDFSKYYHGFHRLSFVVDGKELFGVLYDRVPLREGHQIRLVYLQDPEAKRRGRFHKAYMDTEYRLPFFPGYSRGSGTLNSLTLTPGRHEFTLTCTDYNGNAAVLRGAFQSRAGQTALQGGANSADTPSSASQADRIDPAQAGELLADRGKVRVRYQRGAVFFPIDLTLTPLGEGAAGYAVRPEGVPLDGGLEFIMRLPQRMHHAGIYRRDGSTWEFRSRATPDSNGFVSIHEHSFLGDFSLREDTHPPEIYRLKIEKSGSRPRIFFRFRDDLAGVEYKELKLYIDKTLIIPEIDGEHRRATARPGSSLTRGSHLLTISIADNMGNTRVIKHPFRVR
jgi:hypothetical protein